MALMDPHEDSAIKGKRNGATCRVHQRNTKLYVQQSQHFRVKGLPLQGVEGNGMAKLNDFVKS